MCNCVLLQCLSNSCYKPYDAIAYICLHYPLQYTKKSKKYSVHRAKYRILSITIAKLC